MTHLTQLSLLPHIPNPKKQKKAEWGTFKDSLRAPVHRWFTYPAGFSYKAVQHTLEKHQLHAGQTIYDPFMGSGTTNLTAKTVGLHSYGTEAHPFVYRIAQAKLNWEIDLAEALRFIQFVNQHLSAKLNSLKDKPSLALPDLFPELILKCYEIDTLADLWALRDIFLAYEMSDGLRDFFFVVITALLREVSSAATGWPYIAPKKKKVTSPDKNVLTEFSRLSRQMLNDIDEIKTISHGRYTSTTHTIFNADAKDTTAFIPNQSADHIFTSPPYLNNFDYADRTRLELYFWGEAQTWGDISKQIRTKLMTSATTQISRTDSQYDLSAELAQSCPQEAAFIATAVAELAQRRKTKGGKKSYDLLVSGYFNDIHQILRDCYRVLKPNSKALFILGDSAPYGVHIPTDELIGKIGVGVGFSDYQIEILRTRGDKWKSNPQRHSVSLRESIVYLTKA